MKTQTTFPSALVSNENIMRGLNGNNLQDFVTWIRQARSLVFRLSVGLRTKTFTVGISCPFRDGEKWQFLKIYGSAPPARVSVESDGAPILWRTATALTMNISKEEEEESPLASICTRGPHSRRPHKMRMCERPQNSQAEQLAITFSNEEPIGDDVELSFHTFVDLSLRF